MGGCVSFDSRLSSGRRLLYICPECGEIGCGAVTVQIEKKGDEIIWSDFRFETDAAGHGAVGEQYVDVGPFRFRKTEYWQVLSCYWSEAP
jgi:hypothetical protein